jgi:mannose/fructose-specific phosphotransferase system component IIA
VRDFRIVVAAHGGLADGFRASAEMICGPLPDLETVGLDPSDSPEAFRDRLVAAVGDPDRPVLILTDLLGGTPHNVALAASRRLPRVVVVSGINLAVLIEAAMTMESLDPPAVDELLAVGREALADATQLLSSRSM